MERYAEQHHSPGDAEGRIRGCTAAGGLDWQIYLYDAQSWQVGPHNLKQALLGLSWPEAHMPGFFPLTRTSAEVAASSCSSGVQLIQRADRHGKQQEHHEGGVVLR